MIKSRLSFGCLTKNNLRYFYKTWGKSTSPDKSAQPQSTDNLATHYLNDFENLQSKSRGFTCMNIVWNSPKLCFPFEHIHCQAHQPNTSVFLTMQTRKGSRGRVCQTGRHTHFLRTSNQGPWDAAGTFSKTHNVPHPARTCQVSNQGELLSSKRYKSACSLTYHQYTHSKCFFPQSWCH